MIYRTLIRYGLVYSTALCNVCVSPIPALCLYSEYRTAYSCICWMYNHLLINFLFKNYLNKKKVYAVMYCRTITVILHMLPGIFFHFAVRFHLATLLFLFTLVLKYLYIVQYAMYTVLYKLRRDVWVVYFWNLYVQCVVQSPAIRRCPGVPPLESPHHFYNY